MSGPQDAAPRTPVGAHGRIPYPEPRVLVLQKRLKCIFTSTGSPSNFRSLRMTSELSRPSRASHRPLGSAKRPSLGRVGVDRALVARGALGADGQRHARPRPTCNPESPPVPGECACQWKAATDGRGSAAMRSSFTLSGGTSTEIAPLVSTPWIPQVPEVEDRVGAFGVKLQALERQRSWPGCARPD